MRKSLGNGDKIFVKSFPDANIEDMGSYAQPSLKCESDLYVLHVEANELRTNKHPEDIARDIICLASNMKTDNNEIVISGLAPRGDNLQEKGIEVNDYLHNLCHSFSIEFIDNKNICSNKHVSDDGLHLNYKGTMQLASNILRIIKY